VSGVTEYTFVLANALAGEASLSVLLMRKLLPQFLYPGSKRVGKPLSATTLPDVPVLDGVDYFWFPSILRAVRFLRRQRPDVLVLEWWSGTVLHSYLLLSWMARRQGTTVVIELHETLDPAEQRHAWFSAYVRRFSPRLFAAASEFVVHSERERTAVIEEYDLSPEDVAVVPFGPFDQYRNGGVRRFAPDDVCNLLFFGLIRPVKGLEDLVDAFSRIPAEEIDQYWLTIVGEVWEDWTLPLERVEASPYRDRISVVSRYVSDVEADEFFGGADAIVLPYRRAAQSAVLHVAIAYGLPVVATDVGGLAEALDRYPARVLIEPDDPDALLGALRGVRSMERVAEPCGQRWEDSARLFSSLCGRLRAGTNEVITTTEDGKVVRA
jgi:glycosyltransferase involved in cell wall biosynthesis